MVRSSLEWIDAKMDEAIDDQNEKRGLAKATGLGALEGLVNACAIIGVIGLGSSVAMTVASIFKKK